MKASVYDSISRCSQVLWTSEIARNMVLYSHVEGIVATGGIHIPLLWQVRILGPFGWQPLLHI